MSLNWKEIDLLIDELGNLGINGAYIQQITQHEFQSIVLHLYSEQDNFSLLLSTRRDYVRMCKTSSKASKEFSNQRFTQLLKSRIRNGKIRAIEQIHKQRIVRLSVVKGDEVFYLYFRMWNNGANIILTDETHTIIDALYRRPRSNEVTGKQYSPETDFLDTGKLHDCSVRTVPVGKSFLEYISESFADEERQLLLTIRKERIRKRIEDEIEKCSRSIDKKHRQIEAADIDDRLTYYGDLILSNIHFIEKDSGSVEVRDYLNDDDSIIIELDPTLSPSENASKYYEKSKKEKQKRKYLLEEIKNQEKYISQLRADLDILSDVSSVNELNGIERKLVNSDENKKQQQAETGLRFVSQGFQILVGRDSKENDILLRTKVRGNDWWLHVRDTPGGYVFIKYQKGKSVPLEVLLDAGNLAVFFSKSKGNPVTNLYCTQVKYLRRAKNAKLGTVIPFQEKNLEIHNDEVRLQRLLK